MDEQFSLCLTASLSLLWSCVCDGNPNQIVYQFCHSSKYFYTPTINGAMKMFGNSGNYYCVLGCCRPFFVSSLCVYAKKLKYIHMFMCLFAAYKKKQKTDRRFAFFSQFSTLFTYYWGCKPKWWQQRRRFFQKYNNSNGTAYKPRANWKRITMMTTATRCSPPLSTTSSSFFIA